LTHAQFDIIATLGNTLRHVLQGTGPDKTLITKGTLDRRDRPAGTKRIGWNCQRNVVHCDKRSLLREA
jgi:hypothetical protein